MKRTTKTVDKEFIKELLFADGTPFGVKVKE